MIEPRPISKYKTEFELCYGVLRNTFWGKTSPSMQEAFDDLMVRLRHLNIIYEKRDVLRHDIFESYYIFIVHHESRGVTTAIQLIIQDQGTFEIRRATTLCME